MNTAHSNAALRPPFRERLLPLLFRYVSRTDYRRSPRFAPHQTRVGPPATLPAPPLADLLAVYLSQRLPPWFIARYSHAGVYRSAKLLTGLLGVLAFVFRPAAFLAGLTWRGLRRTTHSPAIDPCYVRRPRVGNAAVVLGDIVRFRGLACTQDRLWCYFERVRSARHPCRILVHLYPEKADLLPPDSVRNGHISISHTPAHALPTWPRRYAYSAEIPLADLAPGDYRVEIGVLDLALGKPLASAEDGRSMLDLGWVRVAGRCPSPQQPHTPGATHAGA